MEIEPVPSFDSAEATGGAGGGGKKEGETDAEFAARLDNTIADAGNMVTSFLGSSGEQTPMDEDNSKKRSRNDANALSEEVIVSHFAPVWDTVHVLPRLPRDVQDHLATFSDKGAKVQALNAYLNGLIAGLHPEQQRIVAEKTTPLDMFDALEEVLQSNKPDEEEVSGDY